MSKLQKLQKQKSDSALKVSQGNKRVAPCKTRQRILSEGREKEEPFTFVSSFDSHKNGLIVKRDVDHPSNGYRGLSVVNGNDHQRGLVSPNLHRYRLEPPEIIQADFRNMERFKIRRSSFPIRKKSEASKIPAFKPASAGKKTVVSKSPSLPKKLIPAESGIAMAAVTNNGGGSSSSVGKPRSGSNTLQLPDDAAQVLSRSMEDLEVLQDRENGSGSSDIMDDTDGHGMEGHSTDSARTRAAIEHIQDKILKIMDQIKTEQATKEANVNEYLKLAGEADKQQLQRIKQVFEKKNQKSTAILSQLQKKLENYRKKLKDVETYGVTGHKQAKEMLKDMGHGLKGVVGNIKGAKETIVSKPREFAHLIKNKFGSADNINTFKSPEEVPSEDPRETTQGGGSTLPASFKYGSEEENSSITSGSGIGGHSSPQSSSHNASQHLVIPQGTYDMMKNELYEVKESNARLNETLQRTMEDFEVLKTVSLQEMMMLKNALEEDKFKLERNEDQMNDMTELNQNEVTNLKQDIGSMEEKIEYRLEERMSDIQDLLENCQTRVTKMELQQQQQQIISMEMVENVTFRTILTKLINVVLALLAVVLVFVSTTANLLAPFLTTRARILSTSVLIFCIVMSWQNYHRMRDLFWYSFEYIQYLLPNR